MNKMMRYEMNQNKRSFWIALSVVGLLQAIPAAASKSYLESVKKKMQDGRLENYSENLTTFEGWVSGQPFTFFFTSPWLFLHELGNWLHCQRARSSYRRVLIYASV
ncbi:hypothetical protein XI25_10325 [Paenibacillus sp. DMB20]|nr:hypothetical protein XI25_10325 [Paenibacillus sp. DMB20]